jgi:hypothetical protein
MDGKFTDGRQSRKPVKANDPICPVDYYGCKRCSQDDFEGCCPSGSSCRCQNGHLDRCESV